MKKNSLPPKIANLNKAKKLGFKVPDFFILQEEIIKNKKLLESEIKNIKKALCNNKNIKIIIRSAAKTEDNESRSLAGIFESSPPLDLSSLNAEKVLNIWKKNRKIARKFHCSRVDLFFQKFIDFDLSGVLFTQEPHNPQKSRLNLSWKSFAITEGKTPEVRLSYNKESKKWVGDKNKISSSIFKKLEDIIKKWDQIFPQGADVELGIKKDSVYILQVRPITRSEEEKILLKEKERLQKLYRKKFIFQEWERNNFTDALGHLSEISINFYNDLLTSQILKKLLKKSGFFENISTDDCSSKILEIIGGQVYWNSTAFNDHYKTPSSFISKIIQPLKILLAENSLLSQSQKQRKNSNITIEETFAWLFLSGLYLQYFLIFEKKKYPNSEFNERLSNTEKLVKAGEPHFYKKEDYDLFVKNYYYWSPQPYEILTPRIADMDKKEVFNFYYFPQKNQNKKNNKYLNKQIVKWLEEKVLWREIFLKKIYQNRLKIIKKFNGSNKILQNKKILTKKDLAKLREKFYKEPKINESYRYISGSIFPYSKKEVKSKKIIIVPGFIDYEKAIIVEDKDFPQKFIGKTIAATFLSNKWIPIIPRLKGIILKEGNELSHLAITAREYSIPLVIDPEFFKK